MRGRRVYIVDFALPLDAMRAIALEASAVFWFDHHQTNVSIHEALGWGVVDLEECGASLTWKQLFPDEPLPEVLRYVRDKDLWQWKLPDSRAICAGLAHTYSDWNFANLLDADLDQMRDVGERQLKQQAKRVQQLANTGVESKDPYGLMGRRALVVNSMREINELGEFIYADRSNGGLGYDVAIMFGMLKSGRWVHSLRAKDVDCERIAQHRGGGGHAGAASYVADTPFPLSDDCLDWPQQGDEAPSAQLEG